MARRVRIGNRGMKYFQEHRLNEEVAFSTDGRGYITRYRVISKLIAAGILDGQNRRDRGAYIFYPVLREPTARDI